LEPETEGGGLNKCNLDLGVEEEGEGDKSESFLSIREMKVWRRSGVLELSGNTFEQSLIAFLFLSLFFSPGIGKGVQGFGFGPALHSLRYNGAFSSTETSP
jgi:hypothetical protein